MTKNRFSFISAFLLLFLFAGSCLSVPDDDRPFRDAALRAAKWISDSAVSFKNGTTWPANPEDQQSIDLSLYAGAPGVVLFFLEAYCSTAEQSYLAEAKEGADYLLNTLSAEEGMGLYTGLSGIAFALEETYKATKDQRYRDGVLKCLQLISESAKQVGRGVQWSDTTDIISGNAGTGLFLIYAARELNEPKYLELAAKAGKRLIEVGETLKSGMMWRMDPEYDKLMPNFSHGTAGIAYFLATLYMETKEQEFLDVARTGALYLINSAYYEGGVCLVSHHEPGGEDLFYLGWCHGPVGTTRLFYRLYEITGEESWLDLVKQGARGILQSGIPEKQTPGFWNNVGICCGSAGVAEFFLDLYRATGDQEYIDFCKRVTADMLDRATAEGQGLKWIHAEHRVKPELLLAQTGYMQGAAGIGMFLLHLDAFGQGKTGRIKLPDTPF